MSLTNLLVYLAVGKIFIYLFQKFPPAAKLAHKWELLEQLYFCDLCLGVWIYFFIALALRVNIFYEYGYVPIISEFITGGCSSFIVHVFSLGWQSIFSVIEVG